ncbi:MAG: DUF58 domain-containing protein [Candidatus Sericytochromatia bacterium]|nr:DUF58 domain-containing protein [Candidatus Sericytochromatia bacterium]
MTLQAWVQLGLVGAMALAAYQTQLGWLYVMSSLAGGLLLCAWALARLALWRTKLETGPLPQAEAGRPWSWAVRLQVHSPLPETPLQVLAPPPSLRWYHAFFRDALVPADAGYATLSARNSTATMRMPALPRGEYPAPPLLLQCAWPLGLVAVLRLFRAHDTLLVVPRTPFLPQWPTALQGMGQEEESARGRATEGDLLRGVRPYRSGDPLRRIHWRTTARTGQLHTKETEQALTAACCLWLDLASEHHTPATLEHMLEVAAGLLAAAERSGQSVSLASQAGAVQGQSAWRTLGKAQLVTTSVTDGPAGAIALSPRPLPGWRDWATALIVCPPEAPDGPLDGSLVCPVGADIAAVLATGWRA